MSLGRNNIEFHDQTEDFIYLLMKAKIRGLEAIGLAAEGHAKREITKQGAVDTGRLRNSITYALAGEFPHVKQYRAYRRSEGESRRKIYQYNGKMPGIPKSTRKRLRTQFCANILRKRMFSPAQNPFGSLREHERVQISTFRKQKAGYP